MVASPTIKVIQGKTWNFFGRIRDGNAWRQLVTNNDQLSFAIVDPSTDAAIVSVANGSINKSDDGSYSFKIQPTDTGVASLTDPSYRIEVQLVDGITADQIPLIYGTLPISPSPL